MTEVNRKEKPRSVCERFVFAYTKMYANWQPCYLGHIVKEIKKKATNTFFKPFKIPQKVNSILLS